MVKNKVAHQPNDISALIVHGIQEKKGNDIVRLDLRNINNSIADYFIICHAESSTQVKAIADSIQDEIYRATGEDPVHKEGFEHAEWILLDYLDVVVHVFKTDKREFYGIEDLWGDAEVKIYQSA